MTAPPRTEQTDWRAMPNQRGPMWHVLDPMSCEIVARNLTEHEARLIAAAPAKAALCEEQARQIEEWKEGCLFDAINTIKDQNKLCEELADALERVFDPDVNPFDKNMRGKVLEQMRAALTKAGRAPG